MLKSTIYLCLLLSLTRVSLELFLTSEVLMRDDLFDKRRHWSDISSQNFIQVLKLLALNNQTTTNRKRIGFLFLQYIQMLEAVFIDLKVDTIEMYN